MNGVKRTVKEPEREIPVVAEKDVVVCGGGPAGLIAAIAAARNGADTLLVERYGFLGGMATAGLVRGLSGVRHEGERIVGGIPWELVKRMEELGGAASDVGEPGVPYDFPVDAEIMKYTSDEMLLEAGAELLFHSSVASVVQWEGHLDAVIVESKSGRQAIAGKIFIDCTGDADVAARAGLSYEKGREEDGGLQNMTLIFILGNLDTEKLWNETWKGKMGRIGPLNQRLREAAKEAHKRGLIPVFGGPWTRGSVKGVRPNEMYVNMVRRWGDGTDVRDLTKAEIGGRQDVMAFYRFLKKEIPELASCRLVQTGTQIGLRETRRINGDYVLTREDIWENRSFPDAIAKGCHPIDLHPTSDKEDQTNTPVSKAYGIPYRCLLPRDADNLLVAGRCISATHDAQATIRVMGTCMAMGEAAGTAAGLAIAGGVAPRKLDINALQERLRKQGAIF